MDELLFRYLRLNNIHSDHGAELTDMLIFKVFSCLVCVEQEEVQGPGFVRGVGDGLMASIARSVVRKDMG